MTRGQQEVPAPARDQQRPVAAGHFSTVRQVLYSEHLACLSQARNGFRSLARNQDLDPAERERAARDSVVPCYGMRYPMSITAVPDVAASGTPSDAFVTYGIPPPPAPSPGAQTCAVTAPLRWLSSRMATEVNAAMPTPIIKRVVGCHDSPAYTTPLRLISARRRPDGRWRERR